MCCLIIVAWLIFFLKTSFYKKKKKLRFFVCTFAVCTSNSDAAFIDDISVADDCVTHMWMGLISVCSDEKMRTDGEFSHSHRGCVINRSGVITIMVRREVMDRSHLHTALRYLSLCIYDPQKRHCYIEHCCVLYFVYSSIVYSKKLTQMSWKSKQHKRPLHIWPYLNKKAKHVVNNYLNPKTAASLLQETLHNNVTLWCFFHFITAWSTHGNRTLCRECAQLVFFMWP